MKNLSIEAEIYLSVMPIFLHVGYKYSLLLQYSEFQKNIMTARQTLPVWSNILRIYYQMSCRFRCGLKLGNILLQSPFWAWSKEKNE